MNPSRETARNWEAWACLAAVLVGLAWLGAETLILHPGFAGGDEASTLERVQRFLESGHLTWGAGRGCLYTGLLAFSAKIFGPSMASLRVVSMLAAVLQAVLLCAWVRQRCGERPAAWAVAVSILSAGAILWQRSLLSFSLLPVEMLALLVAWPRVRSRSGAFAWALASVLCLLDYEGWMFGWPALLMLCLERRHRGLPWPWLALGWLCGLGLLACLSHGSLATYSLARGEQVPAGLMAAVANALENGRSLFWGSSRAFVTSFPNHPAFPLWALPALAWGSWLSLRRREWLVIAALALGLAPLAAWAPAFESHRAIAAWPALCLVAAQGGVDGLARLEQKLPARLVAGLALAWLGLGTSWEIRSYFAGMAGGYQTSYGQALLDASEFVKQPGMRDANLVTELNSRPQGLLNFVAGRTRRPFDPSKPTLAWIPWSFAPRLDPSWGRWHVYAYPGRAPVYLLEPVPALARRLSHVDADLHFLWSSLPEGDLVAARSKVTGFLASKGPSLDPWTKAACWESVGLMGFDGAGQRADLLEKALQFAAPSATLSVVAGMHETDLAGRLALARQALRLDSHRRLAWTLAFQTLESLGRRVEAEGLKQEYLALPPGWLWDDPF